MAKRTNLALLNKVLDRISEPNITATTVLSGRNLFAFNCYIEALKEIYSENSGRWKFAERLSSVTLASGTSSYSRLSSSFEEDIFSFRSEDSEDNLSYYDPQEFDILYPKVDDEGRPDAFTIYNDVFYFNKIPGSNEAGDFIYYKYWENGTDLVINTATGTGTATATGILPSATGTVNIPELYEDSVLVNLTCYKFFKYEGDSEAQLTYVELYGDGRNKEGSLVKMKRSHGSNKLHKIRVTAVF